MGMAGMLSLALGVALVLEKKVYMLQEALVVMLLVAISVAVILLFLVVFVLFQAGIRQAALWLKTALVRLSRLSHGQVSPPDSIIPPPIPR
jgi:hypothetical protein